MPSRRRIIDDRLYAHFVTFSVRRRRRLLDHDHPKGIVLGVLNEEFRQREALCIGFVRMPDHVHGISQSTRSLTGIAASMASHARQFQATQKKPLLHSEGELLVVTSDGKGVPMRQQADEKKPKKKRLGKGEKNGAKRMACVGGTYTIDRFDGAFVALRALFREREHSRGLPVV